MITKPKSKEEAIAEYRKIRSDPIYFICNYLEVTHPIKGIVPFELYKFQKEIIGNLEDHRFNIIRKFRQAGITTISCAYALWCILFKENFAVIVISIGDRESQEFLTRVKQMYMRLPKWLRLKYATLNKHELHIQKTGSYIRSLPSTANAGRGFSASLLIVDEAAFIEGMDKFWAAVYPVLSTGGSSFLISTVNGIGNFYYTKWMGAVNDSNEFNAIQINWEQHPEYAKPGWAEAMRANMSKKQWLQEFECEFLGTGDTFVDSDVLTRLRDNIQEEFYTKYNNRMRVFEEPHPNHEYMMSVDPSLGRGRDYSAFHIIDLYTGNQVAEFYSNKIPINRFAEIIKDEGYNYNTAYVVSERNGVGQALIDILYIDKEYENLWMDEKDLGIQISNHNRDKVLALLEQSLREGWFRIKSERCVDELLTFVINEKTGKAEADEGQNDDLVMAVAFAAYAVDKLGTNAPLFIHNEVENRNKFNTVSIVSTKEYMGSPMNPKLDMTREEYLKWVNG
jgi:hypothetical protein